MANFKPYDKHYRAQRRLQGEDGNKVKVFSPFVKNVSGRRFKNGNVVHQPVGAYGTVSPDLSSKDGSDDYLYLTQYGKEGARIQPQKLKNERVTQNVFNLKGGIEVPNILSQNVSYGQNEGSRSAEGKNFFALQPACEDPRRVHKIGGGSRSIDEKMSYSSESDRPSTSNQPVDLVISNLDSTIETRELKRLLTSMLKEYVMILSLNVITQADGTPLANVKVNSQQEAQFAISQLHRQKLGHKRIIISYYQNNSPDPDQLRAMVIGLLQEVPDRCMPLFKFIELLEARYHCTVSVSEVNKLKDICKITDILGARIICLTNEVNSSTSDLIKTFVPYCTVHCPNGLPSRGWCELDTIQTPSIMMSLKLFANKSIDLLKLHSGCMPMLSFQICYEQEYREQLPVDDSGVPLEHLIVSIPGMKIKYVGPNNNTKVIKYDETGSVESDEDAVMKSIPPSLAPNVSLLCRELVDLLKTTDRCQLLLSKFIPAYHHHFGRQCRVADYGYTKLLDLFESIPHVIQIMGDGTRRVITLSHSAQMRRFTSDLLRVLKVQPSKQIKVTDFPLAYEKVMNKSFNAVEYGLCSFEDLLQEVPENTIVVSRNDEGTYIAVPKREQTAEEIMRTKQFALEVIDLLRHSPYYTMLFNKFVPAYHHHFGHQCKVSDYGFTKLIELFEALPDVVKIDELSDGERTVSLTLEQSLKILGSQLVQIIKASNQSAVLLEDIPRIYLREYGYPLKPQLYKCDTIIQVIQKLYDYVQLINGNAGPLLIAVAMDTLPNTLRLRSWALLLHPPHYKDMTSFRYEYQSRYGKNFSTESLYQIRNVVSLSADTNIISLTVLYVLAAQIYHVVYKNGGNILYNNLEKLYFETYGKQLKLSNYHIHSVDEFYNHFNLIFFIRSNKKRCTIVLNRNLAEHLVPLPSSIYKSHCSIAGTVNPESVNWPSPSTELVQTVRKVSPPKPDTPPTPVNTMGCNLWNNWSTSSTFDSSNSLNLSIQMPIVHSPKLLGNPESLISPARHLLPAHRNPWGPIGTSKAPPDPSELPMPEKLIMKGNGTCDDSADSGVHIKLDNSPSDNENDMYTENRYGRAKKLAFASSLFSNN